MQNNDVNENPKPWGTSSNSICIYHADFLLDF